MKGVRKNCKKATISFVMSLRMSVRLSIRMEQLVSHCTDFHDTWHLNTFRKPVEKLAKTGHRQHSSKFFVCVFFVIRIVLLLIVLF
jgi:hypothetical protein